MVNHSSTILQVATSRRRMKNAAREMRLAATTQVPTHFADTMRVLAVPSRQRCCPLRLHKRRRSHEEPICSVEPPLGFAHRRLHKHWAVLVVSGLFGFREAWPEQPAKPPKPINAGSQSDQYEPSRNHSRGLSRRCRVAH